MLSSGPSWLVFLATATAQAADSDVSLNPKPHVAVPPPGAIFWSARYATVQEISYFSTDGSLPTALDGEKKNGSKTFWNR